MKEQTIFFALIFCLLLPACSNQKQAKDTPDFPPPEVFEAKGYFVPQDKMAPPEITPAIETVSRAVSKPKVTNLKSNIYPVGKPKVVAATEPKVCTPGENGYSLPDTVPAVDSTVPAGLPEEVLVKDIQVKDNNSASFTPFNTLNGLKANLVGPIISDKKGNIWAGCYEGGLSKYDGRSMTNYTSAQGLSNETFSSMFEDSRGNLWLGYWNIGLDKFDGKSFTKYTTRQGLGANSVICILEDSKGILWIGTAAGVSRYDGKTFTNYTSKQGLINRAVTCIMEDIKGNLWFGTDSGVSRFDGRSFSNYTAEQGLSNSTIKGIVEDNNGDIWFCTHNDGICKYDGRFFEHFLMGLPNYLTDIILDRKRNLWMSSSGGGIVKYDRKSFTQFTVEDGLSSNYVNELLQDKRGIFWMSTPTSGICRFDGETFTHFIQGQSFSHGNFHSIMEDKSGTIWTSIFGGELNKYDGKTVTEYNVNERAPGDHVAYSLKDRKGNLWIGSIQGGALNKYDGKVFTEFKYFQDPHRGVWTIFQDSKGNIWFGGPKGLDKYDGVDFIHFGSAQGLTHGLTSEMIDCIIEDKNGNLWLGTDEGVVIKFDLSAAGSGRYSFTNYKIAPGTAQCFVYSAASDKENNLWFSTTNSGAVKFDGKFFTRYTTAQGLSNISVNSIVKDKDDNMWFLTKTGLCKMLPPQTIVNDKTNPRHSQTSLFANYLFADGFFGGGSQFNTMTVDRNGNIWAGVNNRITVYHPEGDIPDTIPPHIELTGLTLFNEKMNWLDVLKKKDTPVVIGNGVQLHDIQFKELGKWNYIPQELNLPYNNNHVTFQFLGITTKKRDQVKYKYMLEGFDENWSSLTSRTEASYTNLPHGNFTFRVKAANSEGYWSDELKYTFAILPPWWKTWWFRTLAALVVMGGIYGYIQYRSRNLKQQNILLEKKVNERTNELVERTNELHNSLSELKTTQDQLIHSEKMASLGELTSGIAHEIKNPLNFINNFSELNLDLLTEVKEEQLANPDEHTRVEMAQILKTLKKNSEKINHHGKRVDDIVKSMLQHSRVGNLAKEPVNINALCDESLKLAWHGFKAKEKTFHASFETHFDPDLLPIMAIPQELSRVLLNLFNNAFYAVHEKKKKMQPVSTGAAEIESPYTPMVTVTTKKRDNKIMTIVSDNGTGMPQKIISKIFQPFFTTKPAGEGTGLGLSMSYDIITKSHGGELHVKSIEGEGTDFEIQLPAIKS